MLFHATTSSVVALTFYLVTYLSFSTASAFVAIPVNKNLHRCPTSSRHSRKNYGQIKVYDTNINYDIHGSALLVAYDDVPPLAVGIVALVLGVSAQTFINSMLGGDQGLGAFLSDGSGYGKSKFKARKGSGSPGSGAPLGGSDPLPWLKLPKLDFVEVAGQEDNDEFIVPPAPEVVSVSEQATIAKLESLSEELRLEIKKGDPENLRRAKVVRAELETLMKKTGFEYNPET